MKNKINRTRKLTSMDENKDEILDCVKRHGVLGAIKKYKFSRYLFLKWLLNSDIYT